MGMIDLLRRPMISLAAVLALACGWPAAAQEQKPVAVVELFTSQGCSSCPPADALLQGLAARADVIALSLHIDYWDHLGWKDTLAKPMFTARQQAYARARGDRQVYTPQMIVNGQRQIVGSDAEAIERAMAETAGTGAMPVPVQVAHHNGQIHVKLPVADEAAPAAEVWLMAVQKKQDVLIERGENQDRRMVYVNAVRKMIRLGEWSGRQCQFMIDQASVFADGADMAVVLVQEGTGGAPGAIRGAVMVPAVH